MFLLWFWGVHILFPSLLLVLYLPFSIKSDWTLNIPTLQEKSQMNNISKIHCQTWPIHWLTNWPNPTISHIFIWKDRQKHRQGFRLKPYMWLVWITKSVYVWSGFFTAKVIYQTQLLIHRALSAYFLILSDRYLAFHIQFIDPSLSELFLIPLCIW